MLNKIKNFLLELFFPRFCLGCRREGDYLCQDCRTTLEIFDSHQPNPTQNLKDLYFAIPYQTPLIKNLVQKFKYEPFIKELCGPLSLLIIEHFQLLDNPPPFYGGEQNFADFVLIPVPLEKRKLKWRGFNQAEEIGKELSSFLKIPLLSNCLVKIKETLPQVELSDEERKENIKGSFSYQYPRLVKGRKILLVDDVYTTGSTLEECARVLKKAGAKEIVGMVVARG